MRESSIVSRLRDRQEWKFFATLGRATPAMAALWWTLLVLRGLAPVVLAIAIGVLVGAVKHQAPLGGPLAFVVPGHDSRLGQVVNNLIDNARSFGPPDSSVRVTCRRLRDAVEIIVDDDGPGIRPEAFDKIFERFYTDRPDQGFGQNSGLGLSISKQIVEAHGGTIRVENRVAPAKPGDSEPRVLGARFVVRLPAV